MVSKIKNLTEWNKDIETQENQTLQTDDSSKDSSINNSDSIAENVSITNLIPPELSKHIHMLDSIVQTGIDTLVTTNLCVLASLSGGTHVFDRKDDAGGTPIILYSASFFKSGGGKTVSAGINRQYFLDWLEKEISQEQDLIDKRQTEIEIEIKRLGNSANDRQSKSELEEELLELKTLPDVYLEDATPEGLELSIMCGSKPFLFIDNFGKYLSMAAKNEQKANMLRMLDNIFDSGKTTTRRLKGDKKRATQLSINGLGANFASTLGNSNLKPIEIKNNIENGFLNKVLITFQDTMDKQIPIKSSLGQQAKSVIENFAKKFHTMANKNHFYLDNDAYNVYVDFHQKTSKEFIYRYNNDEDMAGLIIRFLKISKRIACLFEIASKCDNYRPFELEVDDIPDARIKLPISAINMERAILFITYLKEEHISKILLYAESSNGKLSKKDIVFHAISRLHEAGKKIDHRSILARLSKNQRMSVDKLKPLLQQLIQEKRISQKSDTTYCIP